MKLRAEWGTIWACLLLAGCMTPPAEDAPAAPTAPAEAAAGEPLDVASPAFDDGAAMPRKHTCDGEDVSPALAIANAPPAATHAALLMYDPDAPLPQAPTRNITHWLVWDVPLANGTASFPEGGVPAGAVQGANVGGESAYAGPCPPALSPAHRYVFWAFALDAPLGLAEGSSREEMEAALRGRVLAEGTLVGMYARAVPPQR